MPNPPDRNQAARDRAFAERQRMYGRMAARLRIEPQPEPLEAQEVQAFPAYPPIVGRADYGIREQMNDPGAVFRGDWDLHADNAQVIDWAGQAVVVDFNQVEEEQELPNERVPDPPVYNETFGENGEVFAAPGGRRQKCRSCANQTLISIADDRDQGGRGIAKCTGCGYIEYTAQFNLYQQQYRSWQVTYANAYERQVMPWRINNYSYKPQPRFFGRSDQGLFYGIENELEVDPNGRLSPTDAAKLVYEATAGNQGLIYFKSDGSLHNGAEIVTQPMSFHFVKNSFPEAVGEVLKTKFQNWYPDGRRGKLEQCGLHIHMSRNAFGQPVVVEQGRERYYVDALGRERRSGNVLRAPYHLYKFMKFVYDNKELTQFVAGRPGCVIGGREMCSYDASLLGYYKSFDHHAKGFVLSNNAQLREIARGKVLVGHDRRYMAVNLDPPNTVELRVFKATTNLARIKAYVEFCDAAFYYTKKNKLHCKFDKSKEISVDGFKRYVNEHAARYSNLVGVFNNDPAVAI